MQFANKKRSPGRCTHRFDKVPPLTAFKNITWMFTQKRACVVFSREAIVRGRRGSVVSCATCKREIAGAITAGLNLLLTLCSWASPLPIRVPSRPRSKSGYLVGPRRLACVWSVMCAKTCGRKAVCSPGSWDDWWMNSVPWPGGNCVKSGEQRLRWIPDYKPPPLPLVTNVGRICKNAADFV